MVKLAIVGIFYDGYFDLWEDFLELFSVYWSDCPYSVYIVNNSKELSFEKRYNVNVIHAGEHAEYSRKVQIALDKIDAEYYLLLLDDFFIGAKISNMKVEEILNDIKSNNIKYYCMPIPDFFQKKNLNKTGRKFLESDKYTVSCQPAIWEKNFLHECIGKENYNAWVFEGIYVKSKMAHEKKFLDNLYIDYRNVLELHHGAVQGKLLPNTVEYFNGIKYKLKTDRKQLKGIEYINYKLKRLALTLLPDSIKKIIKKFFKKTSVIESHSKEIFEIMKKMNIQ